MDGLALLKPDLGMTHMYAWYSCAGAGEAPGPRSQRGAKPVRNSCGVQANAPAGACQTQSYIAVGNTEGFERSFFPGSIRIHKSELAEVRHEHEPVPFPVPAHHHQSGIGPTPTALRNQGPGQSAPPGAQDRAPGASGSQRWCSVAMGGAPGPYFGYP